jgi:hypothetical protein
MKVSGFILTAAALIYLYLWRMGQVGFLIPPMILSAPTSVPVQFEMGPKPRLEPAPKMAPDQHFSVVAP